ncbi:hypothetical protein ACJJI4_01425 [Microbulbifer sp. TRSA002]|uniref:hypothetical protein n=1 Tax=Microbulbifer sp. TRSA002 TaxID=3243382 RepID=UPI00403A35D3
MNKIIILLFIMLAAEIFVFAELSELRRDYIANANDSTQYAIESISKKTDNSGNIDLELVSNIIKISGNPDLALAALDPLIYSNLFLVFVLFSTISFYEFRARKSLNKQKQAEA